ncbi:Putative auto-transporter adhesin, head GIN domain [Salegentibacter echinorum]|uniref:Putative auto-transporter adhesin, head GIN domain n=1 Tax=Salegentibacter echinorum TaxID=1073325 RepID=A0A1M5CN70_SALEC|nr:DUF2807 domain-containing protein [Salegentibacter echinorum]SHF56160.1 Putative auto-transporter adhesin, head GIN domain [Salegentibacter echinorum]
MKKILLLLGICLAFSCGSQKVNGSRIVTTEKTRLLDFNSIEISGDFDVELKKGSTALMKVKADDNLHRIIQGEVVNQVLYIKPTKRIGRSKSQEIEITYPQDLQKIILNENVELETEGELYTEELKVELADRAKAYLTITATRFDLFSNGKSIVELNLTAENAYFQLNKSSGIKALVNSPSFNVDMYEKASARIEGETNNFQLRAEHSSDFKGKRLTANEAVVVAEGKTKIEVEVLKQLSLTAKNRAEIKLYGTPKIDLVEFSEKAVLAKKN